MVYTLAKAVAGGRAGRAMALPLFIEKLTLNMQSFHASICQEELVGIVSNPVSYTHLTLPTKRIV